MDAAFAGGWGAASATVLAAVFVWAGVLKFRDLGTVASWIDRLDLGVSSRSAAPLAAGVELSVALAVLLIPPLGLGLAIVLLVGLSLVLVRARARGVGCACFGRTERSADHGLVRNIWLIAVGLVSLLLIGGDTLDPGWWLLVGLVAFLALLVPPGAVERSVDLLGGSEGSGGSGDLLDVLPLGERIPQPLRSHRVELGRRVLVVLSPRCVMCRAILDQAVGEQDDARRDRICLVSATQIDSPEHPAHATGVEVLDLDASAFPTPLAVLVDSSGVVLDRRLGATPADVSELGLRANNPVG